MLIIAICDDLELDRKHLTTLIQNYYNTLSYDIRIKTFVSGEDLVAYYEDENMGFDVIFLDISSNRVNGIKFLEEFRKLDEKIRSGVSLIALSNEFESEAMKIAGETPEVKRFIHKPLTFEVLNEIVNDLL
jgi:DNA-binding LytR/AlgR family response regulator